MIACRSEAIAILKLAEAPFVIQLAAVKFVQNDSPPPFLLADWIKTKSTKVSEMTQILNILGSDVGLASELFVALGNKVDDMSNSDAIELISLCGKLQVYDSELFALLEPRIHIKSLKDCLAVATAMNHLKLNMFTDSIEKYVLEKNFVCESGDWFVLCDFFLRTKNTKDFGPKFVEAVHHQLNVSTEEAMRNIYYLAKFKETRSEHIRSDVKVLTSTIIAYELRNVHDVEVLIRLFFSLSELEIYDDYFIRRKLVPAIFHAYKRDGNSSSPRITAGIVSVLNQLPFSNDLVRELQLLVEQRQD